MIGVPFLCVNPYAIGIEHVLQGAAVHCCSVLQCRDDNSFPACKFVCNGDRTCVAVWCRVLLLFVPSMPSASCSWRWGVAKGGVMFHAYQGEFSTAPSFRLEWGWAAVMRLICMGHDTFRRCASLPRAACRAHWRNFSTESYGIFFSKIIQLNSSFGTPESSLSLWSRNAFSTAIERGQECCLYHVKTHNNDDSVETLVSMVTTN